MERRNTIQRSLVYNAVQSLHRHVSADEVYEFIKKEHPSVGKGTVYRNLNILADHGEIKKIEIPNRSDRFDFTTADHYHVLCVDCDQLSDVELKDMSNLIDSIHNSNGIQFIGYDILFKGICPECQKKRKK